MSPDSMSEAEAEAFEEYCLANPEFARQVEFEQRLKAGLAQVAQRLHRGIRALQHRCDGRLAAAASVLLAFVAAFYIWIPAARATAPCILAAVTTDRPA